MARLSIGLSIAAACLLILAFLANAAEVQKQYTRQQVARHDSIETGAWVGYEGKVYDITNFIPRHPGGESGLWELAGTVEEFAARFDAHHHGRGVPKMMLGRYEIGDLAE
eukprot:jgi/Picsp_1/1820/NSC_05287-R1_delta 5 fatty acid desaturase